MSRDRRRITFSQSLATGADAPLAVKETILGMPPGPPPSPATDLPLQALQRRHPEVYAALRPALPGLRAHEESLFAWLRSDPAHRAEFVADPLAAFVRACRPAAELVAILERARAAVQSMPSAEGAPMS